MIVFNRENKKLVLPSSLGNFGNAGGGSGSGVTPEEVQEMIDESISAYDTEVQVDLEDIRENVSGNTEDIEELSGATVALKEQVDNISLSGITGDVTALSAATVSLSEDLSELSGATNYMRSDINDLSGVTENIRSGIETLSGSTSDNAADIAELSGATESVSGIAQDAYDAIFYEEEGETYSQIDDLWGALGDKQDVLEISSGLTIDDNVLKVNCGHALIFSEGGKLEVNFGKGVQYDGDDALELNIGEGLGFSGNTLVVSGISGGDSNYLIVDSLSEISNPYEGLEAYVRERTEQLTYTGYTIDASQISEGYVAHIYYDGSNENPVYRSGDYFHWDWNNDATGVLLEREDYFYMINSEHTVFTVLMNNPDAYVTFEEGVTTATTSTTINVLHKAVTYRYNGTAWEQYQPPKVYYLDELTQAELIALHTEISRYKETTFPAGNYRFFVTNRDNDEYQGRFELFVARFYGGGNISFSGVMQSRYNNTLLQRGYELTSAGDFYSSYSSNTVIPDPAYKAFMDPNDYGGYSDGGSITGASQEYWANVWETSKSEGFVTFARKTLPILVSEGDVLPYRFKLSKVSGTTEDESTLMLGFSAMNADYDTNTITVKKFNLTKQNDVYYTSAVATSSYTASS